jgi:phosphatidylinositol alpha-1,6-mannosyltransferase
LIALVIRRLMGIPFWCYVHGEELTLAHSSKELKWLNERVLSHAERIIANSQHSKDMLMNVWRVIAERITVIHPGVDTTRFHPSPRSPALRARLGWENRQVVLTVGALQKRKGQDMFIRALPAIRRRCPTILYSMIGEGWERDYLDGLVREFDVADVVQFRGAPDDAELVDCYQQCDLFALPNRRVGWDFEGFGIALLEAQACGKPVVAGLSGGTAETMKVPDTGALVSCDTPQPLADIVCALLADPDRRAAMGASAREWVVNTFDWNVVAGGQNTPFRRPPVFRLS